MSRPMDSTLALVQDPSNIHYGDVIDFTYTVGDKVKGLVALYLTVTQDGETVATGGGFPPELWFPTTLTSRSWTGGAADAVARLIEVNPHNHNVTKLLAEVGFHVQA